MWAFAAWTRVANQKSVCAWVVKKKGGGYNERSDPNNALQINRWVAGLDTLHYTKLWNGIKNRRMVSGV